MALGISEEHQQLAEAVAGWRQRHCPAVMVRAAVTDPAGISPLYRDKIAPALAGQGLLGLHLPEDRGGQGYGMPELAVAAGELGRALLPGGYLPSVLASALIATAAPAGEAAASILTGLADGSLTGAVGLGPGLSAASEEPGGAGSTNASGDVAGSDRGLVIDGTCGPVLGAPLADVLVLPTGESWVLVEAAAVDITPAESIDLTRPAGRVTAQQVRVPAGRVLPGLTAETVTSFAAALFGAEACGIADWAVSTAADYAKTRQQFGRPIGQFQGVKHRCAWMLAQAEQAAAAAWDAARACQSAGGAGRDLAAHVAAAIALDAAVTCTHECIQVLGGIGYTWEHDAHLYYRRALSLRALLPHASDHARRAARLAVAGAERPLTVDLPPEAGPVRARIRTELAAIAAAPAGEQPGRLAGGGWVMPHLPRPWGRDASPLEQLVIAGEMRAAGLHPSGLAIGAWVVPALVRHGTGTQQQRFLPATLRGETVWCQLFSEPGAGSDLAGLATKARRTGGGWLLSGQKVWTSLAKQASWAICLARTDPGAPRHDGITYFLVDMASPGITMRPLREMTGDSLFNEVFLDEVFVPDELVVGEVNNGWRVARTTLANERVSLAQAWTFGCDVGDLLDVVRGLGDALDEAVMAETGALVCQGIAIGLLGLRATLKQLSGTEPGATGSVRKLLGMRYAQRVAEQCWSLTGPEGAVGGTRWSRAMLFTRALTIGGGTTDIQLNIIGERILGLPKDPAPGS
jgi:alkylation response protein AidB-like acyl-CoA dehydrogenase